MITSDPFGHKARAAYFEDRASQARFERRRARGQAKQAAELEARKAGTRAAKAAAKSDPPAAYAAARSAWETANPAEVTRLFGYFNRASAVRVADDKFAGWATTQMVRSTLYKIRLAVTLNGASIRQAVATLWDRGRLGEPPSEAELRKMLEGAPK